MSRLVARAETWEKAYAAFQNVNFAAFDYNTVKRSLLDYVKLYFPETFNDFIESSEFVAIIEVFAYIAELMAYRLDINAHENFITVAQRKDSILRLAKLVSYNASRPLPARGLVKISSISTTESIVDSNGNELANRTIRWNDVTNTNWKDQFMLVMNRALDQDFGSVSPSDRFQLQDVLFEVYSWGLSPIQNGVFTYNATVNGRSIPMELVPITYDSAVGIIERRPQANSNFTLLYGQDGLGDASDTTGFFCFTKQGSLQRFRTAFDGITPNQTYDVSVSNVNDTDIWVNNVDPATGEILDTTSTLPYRRITKAGKSGEWVQVDLAHAQNVIFNTNPKRNKYEVETQNNNRVRLIFGDGEFADVPAGTFDVWVRSSLDEDILIPQSSITNSQASFTYVDAYNRTQTLTFTFSLVNSLQNASASEDVEHIRRTAPAVYYTQDRMVNNEDYNVFMLQDPSILKLRAINRTFAGDSKYIPWHDASGTYENIKIFGDDGILYFEDHDISEATPVIDFSTLLSTYVEPLLSSTDLFLQYMAAGVTIQNFRRTLNTNEKSSIVAILGAGAPVSAHMYYNTHTNTWYAVRGTADLNDPYPAGLSNVGYTVDPSTSQFINLPLIKIRRDSPTERKYTVTRTAKRLVFQSTTTSFWNTNSANRVVNYDSIRSSSDTINILQSNLNQNRTGVLKQNWTFNVLGQEIIDSGSELGLPDVTKISVMSRDENQDGIPDNVQIDNYANPQGLAEIIMPKITVTSTGTITLPVPYTVGHGDVEIVNLNGFGASWQENGDVDTVSTTITVTSLGTNTKILVAVQDYVYFSRATTSDQWQPAPATVDSIKSYVSDRLSLTNLWKREQGRSNLHFAWFHNSPRYYLVDPSPTNIIDSFVVTKGYFMEMKRWLEDSLADEPTLPTPLDLRSSYGYLLNNNMISDTVILHPGKFKLLFGPRAEPPLQATFKVVRSADRTLTDNQIKTTIVTTVRNFFDVTTWEFGETFYFTELAAAIHLALPTELSSVVLVPVLRENHFGTMFQVLACEDEIFYPDITVDGVEIVTSLNANTMNIAQDQLVLGCAPITAPAAATYQLVTDVTSVNEGSTVNVTLITTNVPDGTPFNFTMSGAGITTSDFVSGSLTGTFVVTNNVATIPLVVAADLTTEGPEVVTLALDNGGAFVNFTINDTSTTPAAAQYILSSSQLVYDEGDDAVINLTTVNVPTGAVVGYTITGIDASDLVGDHVNFSRTLTGNFVVGSVNSLRYKFRLDSVTEGTQYMTMTLNNGASSITLTINDTSQTPTPTPAPSLTPAPTGTPSYTLTTTPSSFSVSSPVGVESSGTTVRITNTGTLPAILTNTSVGVTGSSTVRWSTNLPQDISGGLPLAPGAYVESVLYITPTQASTSSANTITTATSTGYTTGATFSVTGTSSGPVIRQFYTTPNPVAEGDNVTVWYQVDGDSASTRIGQPDPAYNYVATSLGVLKSITISTAGKAPGSYTLTIASSDGTTTVQQTCTAVVVAATTPPPTTPPPATAPPLLTFASYPTYNPEVGGHTIVSSALVAGVMTGYPARQIAAVSLSSGVAVGELSFDATQIYISGYISYGDGLPTNSYNPPVQTTGNIQVTDNYGSTYNITIGTIVDIYVPPATDGGQP